METIKQHILNRFKAYYILTISICIGFILLAIRIKLTQSTYFLFLIWNLFLACIPFAITSLLSSKPKLNKLQLGLGFILWLLFLPNAPYIITDFAHLKHQDNFYSWLNILLVGAFACTGMLLFCLSALDMKKLLKPYFKNYILRFWFQVIFLLTGFGIYIGRYLRYNSWEIIQKPQALFYDSFLILKSPTQYVEAWLFTLVFWLFLNFAFWLFNAINTNTVSQ